MLDAPVASSFDAAVASPRDARDTPGGMLVVHVIYTPNGLQYVSHLDPNVNESWWFADRVQYQTSHNANVRDRPYRYQQIVHWYEGGEGAPGGLWPPSIEHSEIPSILGSVPEQKLTKPTRGDQVSEILQRHGRGATHVYHSIWNGFAPVSEEVVIAVDEWLEADSQRPAPLSSPDRIYDIRDPQGDPGLGRWALWGIRVMAQLPALHTQWQEAQP